MKIRFINPAVIVAAMLVSIGFCRSEALDPTAFTKRMPITFSGYSGATPIANFPVLIKLSEGIAGFSYEKFSQGGTNLRFADNSGQALDYEIDTWNSNGTSTVWVRIPELTAETKIYAYWGAKFTEHAPSHSNGSVWSPSSHAGVWHFSTIPGGVTPDSTINNLDATANKPNVSTGRVDGIIGNCVLNSDGSGNDGAGFLTPNYNSLALGSTFTVSGWCRHRSSAPGYERVFSRKTNHSNPDGFESELNNGSTTGMSVRGINSKSVGVTTPDITLGNWYHLTFVYDGATLKSYVNGAAGASGAIDAATDNGLGLAFGNNAAKSEATYKGSFDEFRLRDGLSSPEWIATEYANATNPDFASFGMVETLATDTPQMMPSELVSVDFHSADITWTLSRVGTSSPDISFVYGADPGQMNTTSLIASAVSATGTQTSTLSGLLCNTTYYVRNIAVNNSGVSETPVITFKTPGEPILLDATIDATGSTISISGSLTDIGVANTTVELWFGTDPEALAKIKEWQNLSAGQTFSETLINQAFDTYYCKFRAYNECSGATNETFTAVVNATVFGDVTWTGNGNDQDWNNPNNWNPVTVPEIMDTAIFTDVGLTSGDTISLNANQTVEKLQISTAISFTIGSAGDVTAGYSLGLTNFERQDVEGAEGNHIFGAPVNLVPDPDGKSTWTINGGNVVRMNGVLGATASTTFVKMGTGTFNMNYKSPTYAGPWSIVEGKITASAVESMKGKATVGGTDVAANLTQSIKNALYNNMFIYLLTNGTFNAGDIDHGRVEMIHAYEGGVATVDYYFYSLRARMTGGTINGGNFWNGGFGQEITSYSSAVPAMFNCGFRFSTYYDATIAVQDGTAPIDLTIGGALASDSSSKVVSKTGAGTLRMLKAGNLNHSFLNISGGTMLVDNPSGAVVGKTPLSVNAGATLGGTGFIGGVSGYTTANVSATGSSSSTANVAPGTIDGTTGDHIFGTLTVGSPVQTNNVAFGSYSRLNTKIGKGGEADKLDVYGKVDLSSTTDGLTLTVDPEAKAGTYVLVSASEGVTGTFNTVNAPKPALVKYTATTVEYTVPAQATLILLR